MNQPVAALNGAGSLLDLGTPVTAGAVAPVGQAGQEASFDLMIAKAATGQSVEAGNHVPQDGENLPPESGIAAEGADSAVADSANNAGVSGPDNVPVTPELIGEYRKADISVAVESALQQYRNGTETTGSVVADPVAEKVIAGEVPVPQSGQTNTANLIVEQQARTTAPAVVAAGQRSEADLLAGRQGVVSGAEHSTQLASAEKVAAVEVTEQAGQKLSGQSVEERLAELRAAVVKQPVTDVAADGKVRQVTSEVARSTAEGGVSVAVPKNQVDFHDAESQGKSSAEAMTTAQSPSEGSAIPASSAVLKGEVAEPAGAISQGQSVAGEPAAPVQSPGVLQAVADKLKEQVKPIVAEAERGFPGTDRVVSGQPVNRETAQVVGEVRPESTRPVSQISDPGSAVAKELASELRGRDVAASASDSAGAAKVDVSAAEKTLSGFAETLAMANKSSRSVAETQQMTMPAGLKPGAPAWNQAVNDRVMLLSSQNGRFAEIQLDPPELGSLQVKLQVKNEQVSVVFATPHAAVKDALEQGMPRLREMFEEQGMSLADSSVEDQSSGQHSEGESEQGYARSQVAGSADMADQESAESGNGQAMSLVDYYA